MNVEGRGRPLPEAIAGLRPPDEAAMLLALAGMPQVDIAAHLAHANALGAEPVDLALGEAKFSEMAFIEAVAARIGARAMQVPPAPPPGTRAEEAFHQRGYIAAGGLRVIAPNGALAAVLLRRFPDHNAGRIVLTSRQGLLDALVEADGARLATRAAATLPAALSARRDHEGEPAPRAFPALSKAILVLLLVFLLLAVVSPVLVLVAPPLLLAQVFIIATIAVLAATIETLFVAPRIPPLAVAALPRYSLLVPLYGEANVAVDLVARLDALDYPRDRLETFILLEADDTATRHAFEALALPPHILLLSVPEGAPRTKPRALNAALPFTSGDLLVVYDAEDAPEHDQLCRAAALFAAAPATLACAQGRLAISNAGDGLLTRRFAIDYAALFDCVKSGTARLGLPVPLGGSSNHFRNPALKRAGGWDAWNVTEDADLGIRLARLGYGVSDLASTTWEEAPNTVSSWMNQRTRWMKGWMQTALVHAREPRLAFRQLGAFRAVILIATALSVLLGALLFPFFALSLALRLSSGVPFGDGTVLYGLADAVIVFMLCMTILVEIVPALIALNRRAALRLAPFLLLAPLSYLLVSVAAWRALAECIRRPHHWHKTGHGIARSTGGIGSLKED